MSNKNKKVCTTLNYIEHLSAFASSVDISKGIMSSIIGLNISAIIAGIRKYKSIVRKRKNKHDEDISISLTNPYNECNYFCAIDLLKTS